jgi:hypothetical protein
MNIEKIEGTDNMQPQTKSVEETKLFPILLMIIATLFFMPLIGAYPLIGEWEPYFARTAMEMISSNSSDWFLDPLFLGKYDVWSKSVFCYWMVFPFVKIFGYSEFAFRIPFVLNGIFFVLLVYCIALKLFKDRLRAFFAGFISIFTPFVFLLSGQFMWEITFLTFVTGATGFLFLGFRDGNRKLLRIAYLFMGLGILTKGLLAVFLPAIIFLIYWISMNDYSGGFSVFYKNFISLIKRSRFFEGFVILLSVSSWWFIYMGIKHGAPFFHEFFIQNHINLLAGKLGKPDGPFEFYVWELSVGTFPWIAFFIPGLILSTKKFKESKEELFTIIAFFVPILFFTLSASKLPHYIAVTVPFFSIITAAAFVKLFNREDIKNIYPFFAVIASLVVGIIGKDLGTGINYTNFLNIISTQKVEDSFGRVFDMLPVLTIVVPLMVFFIFAPIIYPAKKILIKISVTGFMVVSVIFAGYINFSWIPDVSKIFSAKKIAAKYLELKKEGDLIVDYDNWKRNSMIFYLGMDEKLKSVKKTGQITEIVKDNPENTVFIAMKAKDVPQLRAALIADHGVNITKIMDDKVDTYKEIELYRVSLRDKATAKKQEWKKNIIKESDLPENIKKSGGTLGDGAVEIVGYTIEKSRYNAGDELNIQIFYKVKKEFDKSWQIFLHFDVYSGALPRSFKFDDFPLQGFYPTNNWKPEEIIRQDIKTVIPDDHPGGGIKIYTGFYIDSDRLPVDREKDNDGQDRFILGTFRININ